MKKIFTLALTAAAALFFFAACNGSGDEPCECETPEEKEYDFSMSAIHTGIPDMNIIWKTGDKAGLFVGKYDSNISLSMTGEPTESGKSASFAGTLSSEPGEDAVYYAYYPYVLGTSLVEGHMIVNIPEEQNYEPQDSSVETAPEINGLPAVAKYKGAVKGAEFEFSTMATVLVIPVEVTALHEDITVNSIKFSGNNGEAVSGNFMVDMSTDNFTVNRESAVAGSSKTAVLNLSETPATITQLHTTNFYMAVAPGDYTKGYTISIDTNEGEKIISTDEAVTLEPGTTYLTVQHSVYCVIPDDYFRAMLEVQELVRVIDNEAGTVEILPEIQKYTQFNFLGEPEVHDLTGIEYFINVKLFNFEGMPNVKKVDISRNPNLEELWTRNMPALEELDASNNPKLKKLYGNSCPNLTSLDISNCTDLELLYCQATGISSLDISKCSKLQQLTCQQCKITSLDITNNPELSTFNCSNNPLQGVSISNLTKLKKLSLWGTSLSSISITQSESIEEIDLESNKLTSVNVSGLSKIKKLNVGNNLLTSIDVSGCPTLEEFKCHKNKITGLDVSSNSAITVLWCYGNEIEKLNISGCDKMYTFYLFDSVNSIQSSSILNMTQKPYNKEKPVDAFMKTLIADNITRFTSVILENDTAGEGISALTDLSFQNCPNITSVTVKNCPSVTNLYLYGSNQATSTNFEGSGTVNIIKTQKTW